MFDCFLAQILVIIMLLASEIRIFIIKSPRIDCLTVFAPSAFIISIINIACFSFSPLNFVLLVLSFAIFIINFRSLLRFRAELFVDHYNPLFFITTILTLTVLLALMFFTIKFRPSRLLPQKFNVNKSTHTLTGNLTAGLRLRENFFSGEPFSGKLYIYEPGEKSEKNEQILLVFAGSICGTINDYEPYLLLLSQKGFRILAGDLYTNDSKLFADFGDSFFLKNLADTVYFRRFLGHRNKAINQKRFEEIKEKESNFYAQRYIALTKTARNLYGDDIKIFYIIDGIDFDTICKAIDSYPENVLGFYSLNMVNEYKSAGFGFIEQTDPFFAYSFGLTRDDTLFIPRYVANKTAEYIKGTAAVLLPEHSEEKQNQ